MNFICAVMSLTRPPMHVHSQMWGECNRYGTGLQTEINKSNLDNRLMYNKAFSLKTCTFVYRKYPHCEDALTSRFCLHASSSSYSFFRCILIPSVQHFPSAPSATASQRACSSTPLLTFVARAWTVGSSVNGCRLMRDERPFYVNEV